MIKVSVLTVGDEICIGQVVNTNASWISQRCVEEGCQVVSHSVVGDQEGMIISELNRLMNISDIVLITGGLGPTSDDLTKPALAKFFDDELVFREEILDWIREFFAKRGVQEVSERNKMLAFVPSKCIALKNIYGTAPGMAFFKDNKVVVSMPGVPKEMQFIMNEYVLPLIRNKVEIERPIVEIYEVIQTCGIPESVLADRLRGIDSIHQDVRVAYLPSYRGVRLRLNSTGWTKAEALEKSKRVKNFIYLKVGDYVYGEGERSLSETIGELLKGKKKTLSVAESCTGGLLGGEITNISGSSDYFKGGVIAYSNEVKIKVLGVKPQTIEQYGAVSEQTAKEMAEGVRKLLNSDYGISITGIAGPTGGTLEKPVGTVWIGLADSSSVFAKKFLFGGDRAINRERSVAEALTMLYFKLKGLSR